MPVEKDRTDKNRKNLNKRKNVTQETKRALGYSYTNDSFAETLNGTMETNQPQGKMYFHMCTYGPSARRFIASETDWRAAFNIIGLCAANHVKVKVLAFAIEDTHLHSLLFGEKADCEQFMKEFTIRYLRHVWNSRGKNSGIDLSFELVPIMEERHLRNAGTYIIIQPTKDGKRVLPCDYPWSTYTMYFRNGPYIPIWRHDEKGRTLKEKEMGKCTIHERRNILFSRNATVPGEWKTCNGLLLPENYVDVEAFEAIYKTHNCFRVFCAVSSKEAQEVNSVIAEYVGFTIEDHEARDLCQQASRELFDTGDVRLLKPDQRLKLAQQLRGSHRLSFRQLATLVRLPESELRELL